MQPTEMKPILDAIVAERERQDNKWGRQHYENPLYWLGILTEEVGEYAQAINETVFSNADKKHLGGADNMRRELIQIAAVAVAALEDLEAQCQKQN